MVAQAHEYTATKLGRSANERGTPMPVRAESSSSVAGRTVPSRWTWISALGSAARSPGTVMRRARLVAGEAAPCQGAGYASSGAMRRPVLALILLSAALARAEEPRPGRIVGRV